MGCTDNNVRLAGLIVGGGIYPITPDFDPNVKEYTCIIPSGVVSVDIYAIPERTTGSVAINRLPETNEPYTLEPGANGFPIVVTDDFINGVYDLVITVEGVETQLDTPQVSVSNITSSGFEINVAGVQNAETYQYSMNGTVIHTGPEPSYTVTGLAASTTYTVSVIAIADGYINSDPGTASATTQGGTTGDNYGVTGYSVTGYSV